MPEPATEHAAEESQAQLDHVPRPAAPVIASLKLLHIILDSLDPPRLAISDERAHLSFQRGEIVRGAFLEVLDLLLELLLIHCEGAPEESITRCRPSPASARLLASARECE